jgi:ATP-binding cassette subfamily B protein
MTDYRFQQGVSDLSQDWRARVQEKIPALTNVLGWLEVDLDNRLYFAKSLLFLSSDSFYAIELNNGSELSLREWPLQPDLLMSLKDYAGVGTLELHTFSHSLGSWRFTLGRNEQAQAFAQAFSDLVSGTPKLAKELVAANDFEHPIEEEHPPLQGNWGLFRLWRFAKPYKGQLFLGFILTLASTAATLVPPYLTMPLMDDVLIPFQNGQKIDIDLVTMYLAGLLGASLLAWGLGWYKTYVLALASERIGADLRSTAYEHLLRLSLEYFGGRRTGDLMTRIGSETDRLCIFLSVHFLDFATDVLMIVMTAVILFSIDPWLACATLLPLPFIAWLIQNVRDRLRSGFEKIDRVWSELTNVLADTIPGIRVVKAFAQEKREASRFRLANKHNLAVNDRVNFLWSLFSPTVTLVTEVGLLVVWAFGIWQVANHQVTVGVLSAFLAYSSRFYARLDSMSRIVSHTQKAIAGTKRIFEILDHVSSVPEPLNPQPMPKIQGRIQIDNIGFRYGNRAVIRGLSLDIAPGEMIGLVGQSGSGKSTMVNLICRFYDVSEGAIRIDGTDIRDLRVSDYRQHIGLVLQEPFLFFGTIADNIAYGKPQATRNEIVAAARAAHAHEFILRLPQGYDSLVGERGQSLSGGERQRISIARALLIDPRILIMDEATSSVDTETEQEIQKALDNLVRGRTTIAIAHRLSTLRRADRLVVMEHGQLVEQGQHQELLDRQGAYWRLYEAQARRAEAEQGLVSVSDSREVRA